MAAPQPVIPFGFLPPLTEVVFDTSILASAVSPMPVATSAGTTKLTVVIHTFEDEVYGRRVRLAYQLMLAAAAVAPQLSLENVSIIYSNISELLFQGSSAALEKSSAATRVVVIHPAGVLRWLVDGPGPVGESAAVAPGGAGVVIGSLTMAQTNVAVSRFAVIGRFSLLTLTMGKTYTTNNYPGVATRIGAIRSMAAIGDTEAGPLVEAKPTLIELNRYEAALGLFTAVRIPLALEYIKWVTPTETSAERRLFAAVFRLLDGTGMGYIRMISRLINTFPWIGEWPPVRAEVLEFTQGWRRYTTRPEASRAYDAIVSNSRTALFRRADLGALNAIAVAVAQNTNTSAGHFAHDPKYAPIVAAFRMECIKRA